MEHSGGDYWARTVRMIAAVLVAAVVGGCASTGPSSSTVDRWEVENGGAIGGVHLVKAQGAMATVRKSQFGQAAEIRVLERSEAAAYSWPCGRVYVTRGLVELATEDELSSAVAHELGHLICDGHINGAAALEGAGAGLESEMAADVAGVELLRSAGVAEDSMQRLLAKLQGQRGMDAECRRALGERIGRLKKLMER